MAADKSASRRSVTPDIAECTTTGRKLAAIRSRSTPAMLRQLAADETLVPPNFRTTQPSLIVREKPLKSIGSISPRHEAAHYIGFCPAFNWCKFLHPIRSYRPMRLYSIRGGNPLFQGYYFLIL